ncbi:hypothetical protein IFO70_25135 [Phormidium tenue FACHB-886]|nr:hypothetical protein [Phormidium tenue FACHB-886]
MTRKSLETSVFKRLNHVLIVLLPIAYVITYLDVHGKRGAYYWTPNQDPDYAYLMNSLVLALFQVPQHTDHPGTPLQILGAIVLWISYAVQSLFDPTINLDLADQVLMNPELYLTLFNLVLIGVTACSLIALGWVALRLSNNLLLALILQISPLLLIATFAAYEPSRVAPDVLLVCFSQILALILVCYLYGKDSGRSYKFSVGLGVVLGVGMATKATFLPTFFYFLLPQGWRNKALALGTALTAFILVTLPILPRYGRTFGWMTDIAIRTGSYGKGEVGLVDASNLPRYASLLLSRNLVFFAILLIATATCFGFTVCWTKGKALRASLPQPDFRRTYLLLVLTSLVGWGQVILTLRQQPWSRYLYPTAGLMGFLVFLLVQLCRVAIPLLGDKFRIPKLNWVIPAIALTFCVAISIQQIDASVDNVASSSKKRLKELAKIERILQSNEYQTCVLVRSRRASTLESALKYGDFWAGKKLSKRLDHLYPQLVFYTDKDSSFETFANQPVSLAALAEQGKGCVLLESFAMPINTWKANYRPLQPIDAVFEGKFEGLYRLKLDQ